MDALNISIRNDVGRSHKRPSWFARTFARLCAHLSEHKVQGNCPYCRKPVFRYHESEVILPRVVRSTTFIKCINPDCKKGAKLPPFPVKRQRREFSRTHWIFFQLVQRHYPNNFFPNDKEK